MPYRRRAPYRRRTFKRRKPTSKYGGYLSTASKALSIATRVASLVNAEYKNYDIASTTTPTTSWQFLNLNLIAQGDDQNQRNGRSILAKSLMCRFGITANALSAVPVRVRFVIFKDMFNAGADPTGTQIFNSNSTEALMNILSQQGRFKVVMDRYFTVNPPGAGNMAISFNRFKKLHYHIKYINTAAATTSNGPGALYWTYICDSAANVPAISYAFRLRYIDN